MCAFTQKGILKQLSSLYFGIKKKIKEKLNYKILIKSYFAGVAYLVLCNKIGVK